MRKSIDFEWFFRSKRDEALCFFIIFACFFEWEKKLRQNRSRECRWSFWTRFLLWKCMILERKSMVFQQLFAPIGIPKSWFFVVFCYVFSSAKSHRDKTRSKHMIVDFGQKTFGVKKCVCFCCWWSLTSQRYGRTYTFLIFCFLWSMLNFEKKMKPRWCFGPVKHKN